MARGSAKVLTVAAVRKLRPGQARREVPDAHTPGLYLVIQPSGRKSWAVRTRVHGKPVKITLKALDLVKARTEAAGLIEAAREGRDPRTLAADAEAARAVTFAELADQYLERWAKPRKRTWREDEADINRNLRPVWDRRTAVEITRRDVLAVIEAKARTAPVRANRLLALLRKMFDWAAQVDLIPTSPVAGIKAPSKERSRDRVLSDAELAAFWRATGALGAPWGPYFRVLALTAQRREEVAGIKRTDLVLDGEAPLWTLPAASTKAGRLHEVPLAPAAVAILAGAPEIVVNAKMGEASPLLFTTTGRPLSAYAGAKSRLDRLMLAELQKAAEKQAEERGEAPARVEFEPWRLHDLRRTAASGMARMGFPPHVVAAVLNHSPGATQGITAIYNRYRYGDEKRSALATWAQHVLALVEPRAANVVALRGAAP